MADRSGFPYGDMYRAVDVLEMLLREDDRPLWDKRPFRAPERYRTVLWLGCHVLRTVHLAEACVKVFEQLRAAEPTESFTTVGGAGFCCGVVQYNMGDLKPGEGMFRSTLAAFDRYQPATLVNWCPSCHFHLDRMVGDVTALPFQVMQATQYIAERLGRLRFVRPQNLRVTLHRHTGRPQQDLDAHFARVVLEAIPGVQVLDTPRNELLQPTQCSRLSMVRKIGLDRYGDLVAEEFDRAMALGADAICTIYHGCHRELVLHESSYQGRTPIRVVNWITVLADALCIDLHDRYRELTMTGDLETILRTLLPKADALGVSREMAEAILKLEFEDHEYVTDPQWWTPR